MSNKVINIMPNTSSSIVSDCERLATSFQNSIYKILIGFPLLFPYGEEFKPVALLITNFGIIFFTNHPDNVDNELVFLNSRLIQYEYLRLKTELCFKIIPIVFDKDTSIYNETAKIIDEYKNHEQLSIMRMRFIESALTGMLTKRNLESYESAISQVEDPVLNAINAINYGIAIFDKDQYKCIEARANCKITAIRGLAGCGKTVVLCKIAANEINRNKDATVCYTYQTRSMYGQAKSRIKDFLESSGIYDIEEAMKRIDVIGAWGGFNNPGLLNRICHELNIQPLDLEESRLINFSNPFLGYCDYVIKELNNHSLQLYDYVLVDEAQDLNPVFLNICYKILKKNGKLVYAYDDFQTLSETTLPSPKDIFPNELSIESFPLSICYRTPPKTLSLAHALSMGIYCDPPTFYQFPASPSDWEAMGYKMEEGNGKIGQKTVLSRDGPDYYSAINSVSALSSKFPNNGASVFELLAALLKNDLEKGMVPEDILVIDLDGAKLDIDYQYLLEAINRKGFDSLSSPLKMYFAGSVSPNSFKRKGHVTFSGIKRAKGNEAFKVYILNAAKTMSGQFQIVWRNRLFTAITRTRLQVVFINSMDGDQRELVKLLFNEMHKAKDNDYKLEFTYPSNNEVKRIIKAAKIEGKLMDEAESISEKLKRVSEIAGNDKMIGILEEIISSSLSVEEKNKLLNILKGSN